MEFSFRVSKLNASQISAKISKNHLVLSLIQTSLLSAVLSGCSGGGGGVGGLSSPGGPTDTIGGVAISALYPTLAGSAWAPIQDTSGKYFVAGTSVTVNGTCGKGVANIAVTVNGTPDATTPTVPCDTNGNFTWAKITTPIATSPNEHDYSLSFTGQDASGNTTAAAAAVVRIDNAPPIACITGVHYTDQAGVQSCTTTLAQGSCVYPGAVPPPTFSYACRPTSSSPNITISGTLFTSDSSNDIYRMTGAGQDSLVGGSNLTFDMNAKTWTVTVPLAAGSSPVFVFSIFDQAGNFSTSQLAIQSASPFNGSKIAANRKNTNGSIQNGSSSHPFLAEITDASTGATAEVSAGTSAGIIQDSFRTGKTNFSFTTNFNGIVNQERSGQ